ncbi:S8 family serine peptidase [Microvirga sp. HBU67558]|uniref:S8 family serine peptidase n=1 Tax=Microvirga TaxID=186650 RepID=UPI001B370A80|nr:MULTISPECIES: S8 family serine peptidase [unclassified Microvirga]MBQ0822669.1 S8 family serine peptidase [Microvirga sp. HBU67558]
MASHNTAFARISLLSIAALCLHFTAASTLAQDAREHVPHSSSSSAVKITMDGGEVTKNLAFALNKAIEAGISLPTKELKLERGDTVCSILRKNGYIPPCDPMREIVAKLNSTSPNALDQLMVGQIIKIPDLSISRERSSKTVYWTRDAEKFLDGIVKNWTRLDPRVDKEPEKNSAAFIEYDRYSTIIPVPDADKAILYGREMREAEKKNLVVDVRLHDLDGFEPYSSSPAKPKDTPQVKHIELLNSSIIEQACESGALWKPDVKYIDYVETDRDADEFYSKIMLSTTPRPHIPRIIIMDYPIRGSGNIASVVEGLELPAIEGQGPTETGSKFACKWTDFQEEHNHANLLASIIASQENSGFLGTWPWALLKSYDLKKSLNTGQISEDVAKYLEERKNRKMEIFLFANGMRDPVYKEANYPKSSIRFTNSAGNYINKIHSFFVVAAGEPKKDNEESKELSPFLSLFPQNMGDQANVLVVTACHSCKRGKATIMANSNYSSPSTDVPFVHVAAPGGAPVFGWLGPNEIGSAPGTSQAAAFVAGVAAGMLSMYPTTYTKPPELKFRLQICSWPLRRYLSDGSFNSDLPKLAAGVVDPKICLFDPKLTWIKDRGGGWRSIKVKGWSPETRFGANPASPTLPPHEVLRAIRFNKGDESSEWRIYSIKKVDGAGGGFEGTGLGSVKQLLDVKPSPETALLSCGGVANIKISDIDDIIVPSGGFNEDSCR